MRMVMNLCSVLILPSPDVSFGCSLEGQRGLCVILTKTTNFLQISFFIEVDFYNSRFRKTCWMFKSLFFKFSSLSPIFFIAGLAISICVSLLEWARVRWILPGYLLFATFVSGLWNWRRTGMIIMSCCMKGYLCMWVHRVQSYYATFLSLSLFLAVFIWWPFFLFFFFSCVPLFQIMTNIFSLNKHAAPSGCGEGQERKEGNLINAMCPVLCVW